MNQKTSKFLILSRLTELYANKLNNIEDEIKMEKNNLNK
jgi:hypothetical protein